MVVGKTKPGCFLGGDAEAFDLGQAEGFGVEFGGFFEVFHHDADIGGGSGEDGCLFFLSEAEGGESKRSGENT